MMTKVAEQTDAKMVLKNVRQRPWVNDDSLKLEYTWAMIKKLKKFTRSKTNKLTTEQSYPNIHSMLGMRKVFEAND